MATLLIRLVAPMQAWGTQSKFDDRDTEKAPSKSGVLGLCAAALGIDRADSVDPLIALGFGVRIDRPGVVNRDYHTAQLSPGNSKTKTDVTTRYYLSDAAFWVGLEGESALLSRLHVALRNPHWPLSLGRKAFQPSLPVFAGPPQEVSLWEALQYAPTLRRPPFREWETEDTTPYTLVMDNTAVPANMRPTASPSRWQDVPDGPFARRRYISRDVLTLTCSLNLPRDPLLERHLTQEVS